MKEELADLQLHASTPHIALLGEDFVAAEALLAQATEAAATQLENDAGKLELKAVADLKKLRFETNTTVKMNCAKGAFDIRTNLAVINEHVHHIEQVAASDIAMYKQHAMDFIEQIRKTGAIKMHELLWEVVERHKGQGWDAGGGGVQSKVDAETEAETKAAVQANALEMAHRELRVRPPKTANSGCDRLY